MRFTILGPLEISDDDGGPVVISRRLHRSALTLLLLNAGQPRSAAEMIGALWGDEPPLRPGVSLRSCVYGIRKVLPDSGRLRTHPTGYLISVQPGELDLHGFRDLASRGRTALDGGDPKEATALLTQALDLWREPPLADLPAIAEKDRLLDQRKESQDALIDARLALGRHRQVLAELRSVVAADPLREHAWAQLMIALYRCGARAEALDAFSRLRMTLVSAYGIEPGPELQDLHRQVLADDPALEIRAETGLGAGHADAQGVRQASGHAPWRPPCQLPASVADFTGRSAELRDLLERLPGDGMAVTVVTGMLGVGKTTAIAGDIVAVFRIKDLLAELASHQPPADPVARLERSWPRLPSWLASAARWLAGCCRVNDTRGAAPAMTANAALCSLERAERANRP